MSARTSFAPLSGQGICDSQMLGSVGPQTRVVVSRREVSAACVGSVASTTVVG